jgi:hypothetical protein
MFVNPMRRLLSAGAVLLAAGFAAAPPASAATHRGHGKARHAVHHHSQASNHPRVGIPQQNGGDRDADNNGGPSDGDGGV